MAQPQLDDRYSGITRPDFRERLDRFRADPEPLNLLPELALLRAQLEDLIERWDEIYGPDGAMMAWFGSFNDPARQAGSRPRRMPDRAAISQIVDRVGQIAELIHKMRTEGVVSLADLQRMTEQMGAAVVAV